MAGGSHRRLARRRTDTLRQGAAVLGAQRWLRPYGLTPHPNIAGGLAAVASILLAAVWLRERRTWQLLLVAAASAEALLTFSRSAWIGLALGLSSLAFARRKQLWPLVAAICLPAVIFVVAFGGLVSARTAATGTLEDDSLSQRTYLAGTALQLWRDHPIFGVGPAQFSQQEVDLYGSGFIPEPVHNGALLVLAETGIIGLAGAGLLTAGIVWRMARQRDWGAISAGLAVVSPLMLDHYVLTSGIGLILVGSLLASDTEGLPS